MLRVVPKDCEKVDALDAAWSEAAMRVWERVIDQSSEQSATDVANR